MLLTKKLLAPLLHLLTAYSYPSSVSVFFQHKPTTSLEGGHQTSGTL